MDLRRAHPDGPKNFTISPKGSETIEGFLVYWLVFVIFKQGTVIHLYF